MTTFASLVTTLGRHSALVAESEDPISGAQLISTHPALELVVGPGVRDAMAAAGDEPRGHEEYVHDQETGSVLYSLTHGRDALYRWTPQDGVKRLPFVGVASSPPPGCRPGARRG